MELRELGKLQEGTYSLFQHHRCVRLTDLVMVCLLTFPSATQALVFVSSVLLRVVQCRTSPITRSSTRARVATLAQTQKSGWASVALKLIYWNWANCFAVQGMTLALLALLLAHCCL